MSRLVIVVDIDVDPRLSDPEEAAQDLLTESTGGWTTHDGMEPTFVSAAWSA